MQQKSLLSLSPLGFHKVAYLEWDDIAAKRTIVCLHGLTRNAHDFDFLAKALSSKARIVCPDMVGRGASDWLKNPHLYNQAQYCVDLTALIARLDVESVIWIGTSMGGLLGMYLAAQANSPIKALILNDIGPLVSKQGLSRISKNNKSNISFANIAEAELYFRSLYNTTEGLTDDTWRYFTEHSVRQLPDGRLTTSFDPNVANAVHKFWFMDINLWNFWEKIQCPVLTLRGELSDVLSQKTADQMRTTGPKSTVHVIKGCGHTPMLMTQDQINLIDNWLMQNSLL